MDLLPLANLTAQDMNGNAHTISSAKRMHTPTHTDTHTDAHACHIGMSILFYI